MKLDNCTKLHPVLCCYHDHFSATLGFALMHTVMIQELYIQRAKIIPEVKNGFNIYFPASEERIEYRSNSYLIG